MHSVVLCINDDIPITDRHDNRNNRKSFGCYLVTLKLDLDSSLHLLQMLVLYTYSSIGKYIFFIFWDLKSVYINVKVVLKVIVT